MATELTTFRHAIAALNISGMAALNTSDSGLRAELWSVHDTVDAASDAGQPAVRNHVGAGRASSPKPAPKPMHRAPESSVKRPHHRHNLSQSDAEDTSAGCCGRTGWEVATALQQQREWHADGPDLFHFQCCLGDRWRDAAGNWRDHGYTGTRLQPVTDIDEESRAAAPGAGKPRPSTGTSSFLDELNGQVLVVAGDSMAAQLWMALVCYFARHVHWGVRPAAVNGTMDEQWNPADRPSDRYHRAFMISYSNGLHLVYTSVPPSQAGCDSLVKFLLQGDGAPASARSRTRPAADATVRLMLVGGGGMALGAHWSKSGRMPACVLRQSEQAAHSAGFADCHCDSSRLQPVGTPPTATAGQHNNASSSATQRADLAAAANILRYASGQHRGDNPSCRQCCSTSRCSKHAQECSRQYLAEAERVLAHVAAAPSPSPPDPAPSPPSAPALLPPPPSAPPPAPRPLFRTHAPNGRAANKSVAHQHQHPYPWPWANLSSSRRAISTVTPPPGAASAIARVHLHAHEAAERVRVGVVVVGLPPTHFPTTSGLWESPPLLNTNGQSSDKPLWASCRAHQAGSMQDSWRSAVLQQQAAYHGLRYVSWWDKLHHRPDVHLERRNPSVQPDSAGGVADCLHMCMRASVWEPLVEAVFA